MFELAIKAQVAGMKLGEVPIISLLVESIVVENLHFLWDCGLKGTSSGFFGIKHLHNKKIKKPIIRIPSSTIPEKKEIFS